MLMMLHPRPGRHMRGHTWSGTCNTHNRAAKRVWEQNLQTASHDCSGGAMTATPRMALVRPLLHVFQDCMALPCKAIPLAATMPGWLLLPAHWLLVPLPPPCERTCHSQPARLLGTPSAAGSPHAAVTAAAVMLGPATSRNCCPAPVIPMRAEHPAC